MTQCLTMKLARKCLEKSDYFTCPGSNDRFIPTIPIRDILELYKTLTRHNTEYCTETSKVECNFEIDGNTKKSEKIIKLVKD